MLVVFRKALNTYSKGREGARFGSKRLQPCLYTTRTRFSFPQLQTTGRRRENGDGEQDQTAYAGIRKMEAAEWFIPGSAVLWFTLSRLLILRLGAQDAADVSSHSCLQEAKALKH